MKESDNGYKRDMRIQTANKIISKLHTRVLRPCVLLALSVLVMSVLFTLPLSAAENPKIKLPDGLYMYDASVEHRQDGHVRVGFGKYFVVKNNIIYSSKDAIKKYGVSKLNRLFAENKNYKILLDGEKIGEIHNVKIDDDENWNYDDKGELLKKNIKEGPMYGVPCIYLGRLGSAANYIAVPEKYKEVPRKVYNAISKEEVDKISKLVKDKLYHLVKNRKEITHNKACNIKGRELDKERIELLDKISNRNGELYIGIYRFVLKTIEEGSCEFEIVFSAKKNNVYVITSNYDDETLYDGGLSICGMLDVDADGEAELIIEKGYGGEDEAITNIEIFKQKADGHWLRMQKISWRVEL